MFPQKSSETYKTPAYYQPPCAKDLAASVEYPNLNVTDMNARLENLSPRLHDCWDSITMNENKHFAIATNRRDGAQWWGMFFGYKQLQHMTVDNADYKFQSQHLVNIVRYATENILLVATGNCSLQLWSTYSTVRAADSSPYCLFLIGENTAHYAPINQLTVFKGNKTQAVSTCLNSGITVWDLSQADLCSTYSVRCGHTDKITGLATSSAATSPQFLTCDRVGLVRLWDVRKSGSTCLYNDDTHMLSFTCATWAAPTELQGDNYIYLGDFDGNVHTVDIRLPGKLVETVEYFKDGHVSQLLPNGSYLAGTSNLPAAVKIEKLTGQRREFVYSKENIHSRCTDAIWTDEQKLLTIGHGCKMVKHEI